MSGPLNYEKPPRLSNPCGKAHHYSCYAVTCVCECHAKADALDPCSFNEGKTFDRKTAPFNRRPRGK